MSFPKAPIKRFNDAPTCAPPPGSYDVKSSDSSKGPVSFDKSQRFRNKMGDVVTRTNLIGTKPSPATARKLQSLDSKPNSSEMKAEKDLTIMKDIRTRKELEKEIRVLIAERGQQDKRLQALEEDLAKFESKLCAAVREKTSLLANMASLEKQLLELSRTNELLKLKFSEDGTQKKTSLWIEVTKLRNRRYAKKMGLVKQEDIETKLHVVQRNLEQSQEKVAQLEEQLTATERQVEEKCDLENLLEYIAELVNVAEQVDKYKLDVVQLETTIEAKNKDIDTLQNTHQLKEATLFAQTEELHEKCKMLEQQKEKFLIEYGEKEQTLNVEIELLKEKLNIEEQGHQKQKEACKEVSAAMHQKLFEFQEEVAKEKQLLQRELRETMDELEKLHAKESNAEMLLKCLEQVNKSQIEELAQLEAKLQGKNAELDRVVESHSSTIVKMQEEHSYTLCKLGETIAEFETYKVLVAEEITRLGQDKTTLQDKLLETSKTVQHMTQVMKDVQHAKEKAKEEYARMLLDAQTKVALKDAEIKIIKEFSVVEIANLQARLEEQSEEFKKQLETERKTIAQKVEADCRENLETWRILYEELLNKVKPFQKQLDAYEAEKNALLNENGAAQEELNKLSDAYAKLLGHQNQKQKIKHVVKLKDENAQLKQEVSRLRSQLAKEKKIQGELQEQMNEIQGVKRFDPSKAFQHSTKENVDPKTPFKESNRNKTQLELY
ncbi:hyaluronan mediated motility receptor isoform X1 [Rhineura floridana]|uniref:hyaluronan mediated motility receptor isoform X1 n=1 Tax=Rhineura floridana TaxID=261503 RepID=UPI002AC89077|nr:hyaluronan mediated motility receptor isoform X1 [Rhineura floridana]